MTCGNILKRGRKLSNKGGCPEATQQAVIAGLDPAIPIMWHGRGSVSGMAGSSRSSPAMTIHQGTGLIVSAGVAVDLPAGRVFDEAELVAVERADCVVDHVADLAGRSHNSHE
jgi:hypothetical protein